MALSDSIHSIHWDIVIRFLVVLRKRWQSRRAPIEKNGADAVLFGLHLLYFPSVSAFCAGQKSVAYMSWTESICIWGKKDKRTMSTLWGHSGSFSWYPDGYCERRPITPCELSLSFTCRYWGMLKSNL